MLDFEEVFFSRAQWEREGNAFGLRSWHGFGGSGVLTPDGEKITFEEGKQWHKDNIVKGRYILWQENVVPAKNYDDNYFMWLESLDDQEDSFKVELKLVSDGYDGAINVLIYRVLDQEQYNKIKEHRIFNFIKGPVCVHFIGPDDQVPALSDVRKFMVLFAYSDKSRGFKGIMEVALFNTYEDAKLARDGLNKAIATTEPGTWMSEDYDLAAGDGKFIITDMYYNKRNPVIAMESICEQYLYIDRNEKVDKFNS